MIWRSSNANVGKNAPILVPQYISNTLSLLLDTTTTSTRQDLPQVLFESFMTTNGQGQS